MSPASLVKTPVVPLEVFIVPPPDTLVFAIFAFLVLKTPLAFCAGVNLPEFIFASKTYTLLFLVATKSALILCPFTTIGTCLPTILNPLRSKSNSANFSPLFPLKLEQSNPKISIQLLESDT